MALEAMVASPGIHKVILERYPEGVYVLVYDRPDTDNPIRDDLQDDLDMAKRACLQDFGVTEDMWEQIPNTGLMGKDRSLPFGE